jgi:tetratricopeptide (TPR) repeat protein
MKTIDYSYFIERYNAGEMNQTEKAWFEKELEGNDSLQNEVTLRKRTDIILERYDIIALRNKLASLEKLRNAEIERKRKLKTPRFRYAAILTSLIIIGSLLFFSFNNQSPETIYKKYYQSYDNPGTSRSVESSFNEAIDYFNKGEFAKALEGFQAYLAKNPGSAQFEFLSGVSNMETRNFPDAESSFNKVINREINLYTYDANWYLAMCYIATHNKTLAKTQFYKISESESIYRNKARKILRHL